MRYLADTNVLSATSPTGRRNHGALAEWLSRHAGDVCTSAICLLEIAYGAERMRLRGATAKARTIQDWLEQMTTIMAERILPCDPDICVRAGALLAHAVKSGVDPGLEDALVAASAERGGMTVLTRNVRHFQAFGVSLHDPFESLPDK